MARPETARSLHSTTTRTLAPRVVAGSSVSTKSPFLERMTWPASIRSAFDEVVTAAYGIGQHALEQVLEVGTLGGGPGALADARCGGCLDGGEAIVESLEAAADLAAELVQGRAHARGVEQLRQA